MNYSLLSSASYKGNFIIECYFNNKTSGFLNVQEYIDKGGVFSLLKDEAVAKSFSIEDGVLTWSNAMIDIAPETLYHKVTQNSLPDWVNTG